MENEKNMQEQDQNQDQEQEVLNPEDELLRLRSNSVPKAEAEKWQKKYNQLFSKIANGTFEQPEHQMTEEEKKKEYEAAIDSFHAARGPVEQMKRILKIDEYRREHNMRSVFLPTMGEPDEATVSSADRVRDALQDALDNSNNDDNVFAALMASNLRDVAR